MADCTALSVAKQPQDEENRQLAQHFAASALPRKLRIRLFLEPDEFC